MVTVDRPRTAAAWTAAAVFVATVAQLVWGTFSDLERFADKGYAYRLVLNPVLMLTPPALWWLLQRRTPEPRPVPWWPCAIVMGAFLVDALGNSLDLYDTFESFDNVAHLVTWFLILCGVGLLLPRAELPPWALLALVVGLGAVLAIVWELGEWYTFIRRGTELDGAYEDTLSDELLGLVGALLAGVVVLLVARRERGAGEA